jgi:FkbM family methyltransferase
MELPTWPDLMKFNLPDSPIIFDIGGYHGTWIEVAKKYHPKATIYIFEPVKEFYNIIVSKYELDPNVKIYNFGLSNETKKINISVSKDSSSIYKDGVMEEIQLKNISEFLIENDIEKVHLAKINIEGEEYNLLDHLIKENDLLKFENYYIQFHNFIEDSVNRRLDIIKHVKSFYDRPINYEFIFECWTLKKIKNISCFGDSHVSVFSTHSDLIPSEKFIYGDIYSSYRFGPWLAYNLPKRIGQLEEQVNKTENEDVVFSFGEIDCRAQVHRIHDLTSDSYDTIIDEIINNTLNSVKDVKNKKIHFLSVAPELVENPHFYYYKDNPDEFHSPKGTKAQRTEIKELFNEKLENECKKLGYGFLDLYKYIKNSNNQNHYYLDDIHLHPKKVQHLIKQELLLNNVYEKTTSTW